MIDEKILLLRWIRELVICGGHRLEFNDIVIPFISYVNTYLRDNRAIH